MFGFGKSKQVAAVEIVEKPALSFVVSQSSTEESDLKLAISQERTKQAGIKLAVAHMKVAEKRVDLQRQTMKTMESAVRRGLFNDAHSRELLSLCAETLAHSSSDRKTTAQTFKRWAGR